MTNHEDLVQLGNAVTRIEAALDPLGELALVVKHARDARESVAASGRNLETLTVTAESHLGQIKSTLQETRMRATNLEATFEGLVGRVASELASLEQLREQAAAAAKDAESRLDGIVESWRPRIDNQIATRMADIESELRDEMRSERAELKLSIEALDEKIPPRYEFEMAKVWENFTREHTTGVRRFWISIGVAALAIVVAFTR